MVKRKSSYSKSINTDGLNWGFLMTFKKEIIYI